jgi:hypothetical protein
MVCAISGSAQWIGIEGSAGTLIQVGVRSYRLNTLWGLSTGYFAWVVDTRDASARTPLQVFTIPRCGTASGDPIVNAEVNANGHAHIWATDTGNTWESADRWYWGPGITSPEYPQYASFVIERFTKSSNTTNSSGTMP